MRFAKETEDVIRTAVAVCMFNNNEYVTPEHVLYGLASQTEFVRAMKSMGGDVSELMDDLEEYFHDMLPEHRFKEGEDPKNYQADASAGFTTLVETAAESAKGSGHKEVKMQHLLWGIYNLPESFAVYYLEKQIKDKEEFIYRFQEIIENDYDEEDDEEDDDSKGWEEYAELLNDRLSDRNPLVGRNKEIDRALQILGRKEKNNPVFVGEPGVGKTELVYGIARRIVDGNVPEYLKNSKVFALNLTALVAGTQYRGEFEKRINIVMEAFKEEENAVVFIDEIHNLIGAGGLSGSSMDASNLIKPYLEDGTIRFIGTTTYSEFKKIFSKNSALLRRFQKIDIKEPTVEETVEIINGIKPRYEKYHNVKYGKDVAEYAVELSNRFINDRFLPDKALDLIDEAGAYRKLHPVEGKKKQTVDKSVIEEVLSLAENIPLQTAKTSETEMLKNLYSAITEKIYGQDEAVKKITDSILMSRAGLLDDNKPVASLLFVGPTGVGKTEVAKVLAKELNIELVRFDMSEYAEKHTVAKLIGSPAGYVGYEDGGLLTDAIRKTPHCVLLLDEIEKAHSDIYNVLLQVMDYASLTDSKGQKADFKNVILIMTSNAGARRIGKKKLGFGETEYDDSTMMDEVKKVFAPEFRNRLSGIVSFNHIDSNMARLIADKKINELKNKLLRKNVEIAVNNDCMDILTKRGVTKEYGGREIERIINSEIKPLLVNEILFGSLKKGGTINLECKDDKFLVSKKARKKAVVMTEKRKNSR